MNLGSVTRARPGDRLAPDRVSDFGPADVDRLVEQRTEQQRQQRQQAQITDSLSGIAPNISPGSGDDSGNTLALVGIGAAILAVVLGMQGGSSGG